MTEIITSGLLLFGGVMMLVSALGLARFPDLYTRMHAGAKNGTVGVTALVLAVAVHFQQYRISILVFLIIAFFFLTAPVAAHLIGRVAYQTGTPLWKKSVCDEYADQKNPPRDDA
jgi:multicomponent Na+:H+ antiporter subunit G